MKTRGFTITELLIVLLLSGVAVAIAAPSLGSAFRRTSLRASMDEFISTHSLARSAAVRHGRTAELHIDDATGRFWVEVDTGTVSTVMDTVGIVKDVSRNDVAISSAKSVLCFDARGLPTTRGACEAADAVVIFSTPTRIDTLTITALGRVLR